MPGTSLAGIFRTDDCPSNRYEAASPEVERQRRAKQIHARNHGHPFATALNAADREAEARAILAVVKGDEIAPARLHLRACQLQSANLDLSYEDARRLALIQIEADSTEAMLLHGIESRGPISSVKRSDPF